MRVNKIRTLNWLGYGLEIFVTMSQEDYRELPHMLLCRNKKLNIIIEGRPSLCYRYNTVEHLQRNCAELAEAEQAENREESSKGTSRVQRETEKKLNKKNRIEKEKGKRIAPN